MRPFARRMRHAVCATTALSFTVFTPSAFAQDSDPAASADYGSDEIVVTARRREESLLDVPIAVTAYSGAALEQSGASDITAISDTTPNVTLENSPRPIPP